MLIKSTRKDIVSPTKIVFSILPLLMLPLLSVADNHSDGIDLPDFSRTYGYDIRPDIQLNNNHLHSKTKKFPKKKKKKRFSGLKNKLKSKFTRTGKTGTKYGVQRYTKHTGSKRYGVGLKRKIGRDGKHGVVVHQSGANYELERKNRKYYLGIDQRTPTQTKIQEKSSYLFFGIKLRW